MTMLNNKGFAISGILYTLFILFLLILVSVLSGLSTKKNMLEQSTIKQEDDLLGAQFTNQTEVDEINNKINQFNFTIEIPAPVTGKYFFKVISKTQNETDLTEEKTELDCVAYLKKDTNLNFDNITFIPNDCDIHLENLYDILIKNPEIKNSEILSIKLEKIYSFEEEGE